MDRAGGLGADGLPVEAGFTLIEVALALAILALLLVATGSADTVATVSAARFHGYTQASQLMRGVVMDIEAEYQEDGFPENSKYGQRCDVPRDFDDRFKCEYDLVALEFEPSEIAALVEEGVQGFMGGGGGSEVGFPGDDDDEERGRDGKKRGSRRGKKDGEAEGAEGEEGAGGASTLFPELDMSALAATPGMEGLAGLDTAGFDPGGMLALAPLFGPDGPAVMDICQINIEQMIQRFVGMSAFFPMFIEEAAKRVRKLTVRLSWTFGPKRHLELEITTFVVGLPEEEMRKQREAEEAAGAMEDLNALRSPDGGVPTGGGTRGGAPTGDK